jgi:putative copper resistance protein D
VTLETAEVTARFLHYTAVTSLFGTWFFRRELPAQHSAEVSRLWTPVRTWLIAMAHLTIASALVWFGVTTARISQTLSAAVDPEALSAVLRETDFGPLWASRQSGARAEQSD